MEQIFNSLMFIAILAITGVVIGKEICNFIKEWKKYKSDKKTKE